MNKWYVLHVITGEEAEVRNRLRRKIPYMRTLAPVRKMKERKSGVWRYKCRALFPGYVFVNCTMTDSEYYDLKNTSGVIKILPGSSSPSPVPGNEMQIILRLTEEKDLVGLSDVVFAGDKVKVVSGPLLGFEGQIVKVDRRRFRAKVMFSLLGQEKFIELGINVVEKIG